MNSDSEEAKTRRFLEDLIDRRRSQPPESEEKSGEDHDPDRDSLETLQQQQQQPEDKEQQLQNQEMQRRRQLLGLLAARQTIGSPRLTSLGSSASASALTAPTNFADEALRRVDEISGLRRSSLGSSFADIMPTNRAPQWGTLGSIGRFSSIGSGSVRAGTTLYPSLNLNDPALTNMGVVPWAVSNNRKNERLGEDLRKRPQALFSLVEAVARETAVITAASRNEPTAKRRKTTTKVSDIPQLKDSRFFLPALPSSKRFFSTGFRPFKAPMKSYKALWRNRMSVLVSHEVRREIFCRAVSRGRVQIQDDSCILPPLNRRP